MSHDFSAERHRLTKLCVTLEHHLRFLCALVTTLCTTKSAVTMAPRDLIACDEQSRSLVTRSSEIANDHRLDIADTTLFNQMRVWGDP